MAAHPLKTSRKRPRVSLDFSAQNLCLELNNGVSLSCNQRRAKEIIRQHEISSLSSSSCEQPSSISSFSAVPPAKEEIGSSFPSCVEVSVPEDSCTSALSDTADSATGISPFLSALPCEGPSSGQHCLGCASSDQEAESCCDANEESEVDITSFLLNEVWEDEISGGGEAVTFSPETEFLSGGTSATACSEVAAFVECSAENGNWFLNDMEGEDGHTFLNEVLDQEWMAAAVKNLDRINDTIDMDLCFLHLLESDHTDQEC